ncbi:MAG: sulfite exporter TauE/SafE family protein [Pseudomonadota bacterium]
MNAVMAGYLVLGLVAGILAGIFGVGGGIIIVPVLIWAFHMDQHQAQGMSLVALLLPVGILGAYAYYRSHPFPIKPALLIALGLFIGAYVGGVWAQQFSGRSLRIAFGVLMVVAGIKMVLGR